MTKKITLFEELAEIMKPKIAGVSFATDYQPKFNEALIYDVNSEDKYTSGTEVEFQHNGKPYLIDVLSYTPKIDSREDIITADIHEWRIFYSELDIAEDFVLLDPSIIKVEILKEFEQKCIEHLSDTLDPTEID